MASWSINLKAPKGISERVEELVSRKKDGLISVDESIELERFLALDLFMSLTKARARKLVMRWVRKGYEMKY